MAEPTRPNTSADAVVQMVEVIYADAARIARFTLPWREGMRVDETLASNRGLLPADIELATCAHAVWGVQVAAAHLLLPGDRLELLPPLPNDPKDARRRRAAQARQRKTRGVNATPHT